MKPALTAEEWRNSGRPYYWIDSDCPCHAGCDVPDEDRHGMAATCLHEQEFGFIREEIAFLERADGLMISHCRESIRPTIDKILALLSPEGT